MVKCTLCNDTGAVQVIKDRKVRFEDCPDPECRFRRKEEHKKQDLIVVSK